LGSALPFSVALVLAIDVAAVVVTSGVASVVNDWMVPKLSPIELVAMAQ
jgi:hypothetical protein